MTITNCDPTPPPIGTGEEIASWVLTTLSTATIIRLPDELHHLPQVPGAYLIGMGNPAAKSPYKDCGGIPLYAGSTTELRRRLDHHSVRLRAAGLHRDDPVAAVVACAGPHGIAIARLIEAVALKELPLCWNHPDGPLPGLGCNPQGANRHAPPTKWERFHNTRDTALRATFRSWWADHHDQVIPLLTRTKRKR